MLAQQYAHALYDFLEANTLPVDELYERFKAILKKRGHQSLLPRITKALETLIEQSAKDSGTVYVADQQALDEHRETITNKLEQFSLAKDEVQIKTDATLIGGFKLETTDRLYDASYKQSLKKLYQTLTH